MRGIVKQFPGVLANDDVSVDLARGEVHALGENGAGVDADEHPLRAVQAGRGDPRLREECHLQLGEGCNRGRLGMVHQHFMLIPVMTVAENIVLATEPTQAGVFLDYDAARPRP